MLVPRPSETTLRNWTFGDVYGPADREVFDALIDVLIEQKLIDSEASEASKNRWWEDLVNGRIREIIVWQLAAD